jgi:DhnA family fructose-bisphosphate aldolase class Ia
LVFGFLFRSKLGLGARNKIYDERNTDDRFGIVVDAGTQKSEKEINAMMEQIKEKGAMGVEVID